MDMMSLSRGLGWFSLGLGLTEVLAPDRVAGWIGAPKRRALIRTMGMREIGSGIWLLARRKPKAALWSRVAGDAVDLGLLAAALSGRTKNRRKLVAATAAVAGVTAVDVLASRNGVGRTPIHIQRSVTIDRPAEQLYEFWRRIENLPAFMTHLQSVRDMGGARSHWAVKGPAGTRVEWDADITEDRPNELISWRSAPGADVQNAGSVRFERAPGGRGTIVRLELDYTPPAGTAGAYVARIFGEAPEKQIPVELMRFKQLMETGEIARTEGQPAGRSSGASKLDEYLRT
jgi:uncharacterized membrane protein